VFENNVLRGIFGAKSEEGRLRVFEKRVLRGIFGAKREESRLRMFENRVLRLIFEAKRDEITGIGENYIMRNLMICTANQILFE